MQPNRIACANSQGNCTGPEGNALVIKYLWLLRRPVLCACRPTGAFHLSNLQSFAPRKMIATVATSDNTRRWPRLPVDIPVRVVTSKGFSTTVVEGRGTEMSEGGMVLYAGILLNPGDLLEIEFDTPTPSRLPAIVRSRNGFCFGLEFITPLPA